MNRLFVLSFEDEVQQKSYKQYYLPTVEVKNFNITIRRHLKQYCLLTVEIKNLMLQFMEKTFLISL